MISAQTIRKVAFFIAVASFVFTIIYALVDYLLLDLTTISSTFGGVPVNYYLYSVLVDIAPYLFIGVVALIVALSLVDDEPAHERLPSTPKAP